MGREILEDETGLQACAFSIFFLVEIVQLFALAFIAHSRMIHPPNS
jgi:hypothetical protein